MINKYFDKIYYINLDRRTDRRKHCEEQLAKFGIVAERVPAFDTAILGISGAIGCHKSHVKVLKDAQKEGYERILLLEDDILFTPEFESTIIASPPDSIKWDMLYFGATIMKRPIPINEHFMKLVKAYAAQALGFTSYMIDCVLKRATDANENIDVLYSTFHLTHECIAYRKPLIIQKPEEWSDIEQRVVSYNFVPH